MATKTYISSLGVQLTFPVKIKESKKFISLTKNNDYSTSNVELQKAIEMSKAYKSGQIILIKGTPEVVEEEMDDVTGESDSDQDQPGFSEPTVYEDVTDIQGAIMVLKGLGVSHQSLRNPEAITKKAKEMNVSFPLLSL